MTFAFLLHIRLQQDHITLKWSQIVGTSTKDTLLLSHPDIHSIPIPLRVGDFNNDGYPDLLVATDRSGVRLLKSVPCTAEMCGAKAVAERRRGFEDVTFGTESVRGLMGRGVVGLGGAFMDLDEDVSLWLLMFLDIVKGCKGRN